MEGQQTGQEGQQQPQGILNGLPEPVLDNIFDHLSHDTLRGFRYLSRNLSHGAFRALTRNAEVVCRRLPSGHLDSGRAYRYALQALNDQNLSQHVLSAHFKIAPVTSVVQPNAAANAGANVLANNHATVVQFANYPLVIAHGLSAIAGRLGVLTGNQLADWQAGLVNGRMDAIMALTLMFTSRVRRLRVRYDGTLPLTTSILEARSDADVANNHAALPLVSIEFRGLWSGAPATSNRTMLDSMFLSYRNLRTLRLLNVDLRSCGQPTIRATNLRTLELRGSRVRWENLTHVIGTCRKLETLVAINCHLLDPTSNPSTLACYQDLNNALEGLRSGASALRVLELHEHAPGAFDAIPKELTLKGIAQAKDLTRLRVYHSLVRFDLASGLPQLIQQLHLDIMLNLLDVSVAGENVRSYEMDYYAESDNIKELSNRLYTLGEDVDDRLPNLKNITVEIYEFLDVEHNKSVVADVVNLFCPVWKKFKQKGVEFYCRIGSVEVDLEFEGSGDDAEGGDGGESLDLGSW